LTVAATHHPEVSRLTLVTAGDDAVIAQIINQSRKLVDVLEIADLTSRGHLESELLIVKVVATPHNQAAIADFTQARGGSVLDASGCTRTLQFAGDAAHVSAVLADLGAVADVLEIARSGTAALERGEAVLALPGQGS